MFDGMRFFFFNLFCFQIHFSFEYWVCTKHLDFHCCNFELTSFCLIFNGQIICGIWWWRNEAWGDLISTDVRLYITFMPSSLHTSHDISAVHDEQRKICIVLKKLANNLINLCTKTNWKERSHGGAKKTVLEGT